MIAAVWRMVGSGFLLKMAELKTKKTKASVREFIDAIEDSQKRDDARALLKIFKDVTKKQPVMWGSSIIGFGQYHYKSERSSQEGDWPLTGFSPRKQNISIYIMPGFSKYQSLLKKLGKYKVSGGSCLYIKRLEDVDVRVLKELILDSVRVMQQRHRAS